MNKANVIVDNKALLAMFAELDERRRKQVYRATLNNSANILIRQTRNELRKVGTKAGALRGKSLEKGIKKKVARDVKSVKVHLLGDYRLKFFEMGTKDRKTKGHKVTGYYTLREGGGARKYKARKGKGGYRGRITASHFFNSAKAASESQIFNEMDNRLSTYIQKINAKYAKV